MEPVQNDGIIEHRPGAHLPTIAATRAAMAIEFLRQLGSVSTAFNFDRAPHEPAFSVVS